MPQQSGRSVYGAASHAVWEPRAPSTNRSPPRACPPVAVSSARACSAVVTASPPVAADLHPVVGGEQFGEVVAAGDVRAAAFVHGDDAVCRVVVEGGGAGPGAFGGGEQGAGGGADTVVRGRGQRALRVVAVESGEVGGGAQRGGGRRGVGVDAGEVDGAAGGGGVEVVGGGGGGVQPAGLVPPVPPHDGAGVPGGMVAHLVQRLLAGPRVGQVETGQGQAVRGDVHVGVDEGGCDERPVEVDDLGVRVQGAAGPVLPHPHDLPVGDGHRGGVGGAGAVDAAADEELSVRCGGLHGYPVCPVTAGADGAGGRRSRPRARSRLRRRGCRGGPGRPRCARRPRRRR